MKCEIVCYAISGRDQFGNLVAPGGYAAGAARAVSMCRTHNFDMGYLPYVQADTLCPIGRIEEATEVALALIEEANK